MSAAGGPVEQVSAAALRWYARRAVAREVAVRAEGLDRVPVAGPVVLAARHYHHLHDATVLMTLLERRLHILVALDWVRGPRGRRVMETLCRMARWPTVLRRDSPHLAGAGPASAYHPDEWHGMMRRAIHDCTALMRDGRALLVFPEGYPNVDPEIAMKDGPHEFLPFRNGFARIVARAQRAIGRPIPVVPVGFRYRPTAAGDPMAGRAAGRWQVAVRVGEPRFLALESDQPGGTDRAAETDLRVFVGLVEDDVRRLSAAPVGERVRV